MSDNDGCECVGDEYCDWCAWAYEEPSEEEEVNDWMTAEPNIEWVSETEDEENDSGYED